MTYKEILLFAVQATFNYCIVVLCVFIPIVILGILKCIICKQKLPPKAIWSIVVVFSALILMIGWQAAPALLDIAGEDYVIVQGTVERLAGRGTVGNGAYHGGAYIITDDGEEIQIQFVPDMYEACPPNAFYATVVYGKRSRYLLDIYMGKSIDEAKASSAKLTEVEEHLIYR